MTGLECLREELLKRGCNKAQAESKAVAVALDIIAQTGNTYSDIAEAESRLRTIERQRAKAQSDIDMGMRALRMKQRDFAERQQELAAWEKETEKYIASFNEAIAQCETPEGRDTMRKAQTFLNSTNPRNSYDNYAIILGLAAILSGGKSGATMELKRLSATLAEKRRAL